MDNSNDEPNTAEEKMSKNDRKILMRFRLAFF